jgi:hypothetical protein
MNLTHICTTLSTVFFQAQSAMVRGDIDSPHQLLLRPSEKSILGLHQKTSTLPQLLTLATKAARAAIASPRQTEAAQTIIRKELAEASEALAPLLGTQGLFRKAYFPVPADKTQILKPMNEDFYELTYQPQV